MSFIKNYYINKIGHPTIQDARMSIALYQSILNGSYETIDILAETPNVREFLLKNYIGNFENYKIDNKSYDITRALLHGYVAYKDHKNKILEKNK